MKYQITTTPIPQNRRGDINEKILAIVDSGILPGNLTKEDIFNGYTGVGGLHGLSRADYENYFEYAEDKKEIEQGQFFTHQEVIELMTRYLQIGPTDTICDLSCGAGAFFNAFKEHQCYGCDIDHKAIRIARFLYPDAHIECCDIRYYHPDVQFDFVIGNPPFNLRWTLDQDQYLSQHFFHLKAAQVMKPGGILMCIVPDSYLKDEFFTKSMVEEINEKFSFLFQYQLSETAFKNMGVAAFNTKVICFQRLAESIKANPYKSVYIKPEESEAILKTVQAVRHTLRVKLHRELIQNFDNRWFADKVRKYLFEIKMHKVLQPYLPKALAKIHEFKSQKRPDDMKWEEWEKNKLTENKVLRYLKNIMDLQHTKPRDMYRLVSDKYGFRLKAFSRKAKLRMNKVEERTDWRMNEMVLGKLKMPDGLTHGQKMWFKRKYQAHNRQTCPFKTMHRDEKIDSYLRRFRFYNLNNELCQFNDIQIHDLGLILKKNYSILNWQQGSGKTPAAAAWIRYKPLKGTFIIGPALAINLTWDTFLRLHNKDFINLKTLRDIHRIKTGQIVLMSLDFIRSYRKPIKKYLKKIGHNINLVFDESDEITSPSAKRTQAVLSVFRKARRKLLTTGTTTRNNITELYSQIELLYNNSSHMTCECEYIWKEIKNEETGAIEINKVVNLRWHEPFPPRGGSVLFKQCFNPAKTTVFGIQQHNQSIYNEPELRKILEYTIITRKFKEIAGDKYTVRNVECIQNEAEEGVYSKIIHEFNVMLPDYYASTGNARKDAALRIIRQMMLLIDATSMPQFFKEYKGEELPGKAIELFNQVASYDHKIAIGCTSLKAVDWYTTQLQKRFPGRPVFTVKGEVAFKKRGSITAIFEKTHNGILVCTQQSLKSSVNIPSCDRVIIEAKQWNIPKIEQFFFRFIRYDSENSTEVIFLSYKNTIEVNLMALLLVKERLNDYIKTLEYRDNSDIYEEYDVDLNILNSLITKTEDEEGKIHVNWGKAALVS